MNEKEFIGRLSTIQHLIKSSTELEYGIRTIISNITSSGNRVLSLTSERDKKFLQYLEKQKELGFSDNLTTPSDLFPGIQTAMDMSNPEKLLQDTEIMKQAAADITNISSEVNMENKLVINNLKNCINQISEYIIQKNEIYDLCLDLLKDSDSIYDVGHLVSNT